MTPISEEEILSARSPKGAWTRKTLAEWGVPWPPPSGWKACLLKHGVPFQAELNEAKRKPVDVPVTQERLERMMGASAPNLIDGEPFECEGELDIDPAQLLRKVVVAVISYGHADILWEFPEVLAFFGSRIPQRSEVAHLNNIDERMFEAAEKWPNRANDSWRGKI